MENMQELRIVDWVDFDDDYGVYEDIFYNSDLYEKLKKEVLDNKYRFGSYRHQYDTECCPLLSDLRAIKMSRDGWAIFMTECYYPDATDDDKAFYISHFKYDKDVPDMLMPSEKPYRSASNPDDKYYTLTVEEDVFERLSEVKTNREIKEIVVLPFNEVTRNSRVYGAVNFMRESDFETIDFCVEAIRTVYPDEDINVYLGDCESPIYLTKKFDEPYLILRLKHFGDI